MDYALKQRGVVNRRDALQRFGLASVALALASSSITACTTVGHNKQPPTGVDAYIDFASKPDGDPPTQLDTGQPVNFVQDAWKPPRQPRIINGALVHGELPDSGAFANYYQANLGSECRSFGTSWTVDSNDGSSTSGVMCIAAWAEIYESGTGMTVPRTPGHIVVDTVTGVWQWWISDGRGVGADHLKIVKAGSCRPPASDGKAVWEIGVFLDPEKGAGRLRLPGHDVSTGSRDVILDDAGIEKALRSLDLPATTIAAASDGATVVMVEHFANRDPRSARYPRFLDMWASTKSTSTAALLPRPAG